MHAHWKLTQAGRCAQPTPHTMPNTVNTLCTHPPQHTHVHGPSAAPLTAPSRTSLSSPHAVARKNILAAVGSLVVLLGLAARARARSAAPSSPPFGDLERRGLYAAQSATAPVASPVSSACVASKSCSPKSRSEAGNPVNWTTDSSSHPPLHFGGLSLPAECQ